MTGRKLGVAGSNPVGGANIPRGDEMSKEKFIRVCPFCGSIDVSHEQNPSYIIQATALGGFQCNDCGHHGLFPEVPTSEIPGLKSERVEGKSYYPAYFSRGYLAVYAALIILWLIGLLVYITTRGL